MRAWPPLLALLLLGLLLAPAASAETGEQVVQATPGQNFLEKEVNLTAGQSLTFSWQVTPTTTGGPQAPTVDFDIHTHLGNNVTNVHEGRGKSTSAGCIEATRAGQYFLMWTNTPASNGPVRVTYTYNVRNEPCPTTGKQDTPLPALAAGAALALGALALARRRA